MKCTPEMRTPTKGSTVTDDVRCRYRDASRVASLSVQEIAAVKRAEEEAMAAAL